LYAISSSNLTKSASSSRSTCLNHFNVRFPEKIAKLQVKYNGQQRLSDQATVWVFVEQHVTDFIPASSVLRLSNVTQEQNSYTTPTDMNHNISQLRCKLV